LAVRTGNSYLKSLPVFPCLTGRSTEKMWPAPKQVVPIARLLIPFSAANFSNSFLPESDLYNSSLAWKVLKPVMPRNIESGLELTRQLAARIDISTLPVVSAGAYPYPYNNLPSFIDLNI